MIQILLSLESYMAEIKDASRHQCHMMQVAALSSSQSTIVLGPGCPLVDHGSGLEEFSNEATSGPTRL